MAKIRKVAEPKPIVKIEPVKRVRPIEEPKKEVKKPIEKAKKNNTKAKNEVKKPIEKAKQEVKKPIEKAVAVKKQDNPRKTLVKPVIIEEPIINNELIKEPKKPKPKSDDKYVRFASKDYQKNKLEISEKIIKNEMKFAYFAIDGEDFYHYYILTKNN